MQPEITVLMPNYNNELFLKEAIDSILQQTFTNFTFLIVDDGSTDRSVEIITTYTDPRIVLIRKEKNSGIVDALNIGLKQIETKYIVRMDGDDISTPDRIETLFNFMEQHPEIGACGSQIQYFGNENHRSGYHLNNDKLTALLIYSTGVGHATSIFRTTILKQQHLLYRKDPPYMEDYDLFFRLKKNTEFANIDKVLYNYRILKHNSTVANNHTRFDRYRDMYKRILSELKIEPSEKNLELHLEFFIKPTLSFEMKEYKKWMVYLISQNEKAQLYSEKALAEILEEKWEHFFFKVVPLPINKTLQYFFISRKIKLNHLSYFLKYKLNKLIGRNS
jgi:glycosyltransferase involved in cell wall biosynthesis